MIIFIGGLIGSGKTSLSKAVADKLGYLYFDVDKIKEEVYPQDLNFEYHMKNGIPFSDETRIKVFNKALEELKELSKNHKNIIVDETFHKKNTRDILFNGVKENIGDYIIIWIQTDDKILKERLTAKPREGHMLTNPYQMHLGMKKVTDEMTEADIIFNNNGTVEQSIEELSAMIKQKLD